MNNINQINCNTLREFHSGQNVSIKGWVSKKRDHGKLIFIDLRDFYGTTQLVCSENSECFEFIHSVKLESFVNVAGLVKHRDTETINHSIDTGKVEIIVSKFEIISHCEPLPFQIIDDSDAPEDLRLRYKFLDIRRDIVKNRIIARNAVIIAIREFMNSNNFLEIQTPILTASSPEGARDFLVPSRLHQGKFYALPQAPQIFKQLLMCGGIDRYYQIAPCFRDEDPRADRVQGVFYQLDMELSCPSEEQIFTIIEQLVKNIFPKFGQKKLMLDTFPRLTYAQAMASYGCDKPDLRNPIKIYDVSSAFANSKFKTFADSVKRGMKAFAIPAPKVSGKPRSFFDEKVKFALSIGAGGLAYLVFDQNGQSTGPIAKFLSNEEIEEIKKITGVENSDGIFFVCDEKEKAEAISGEIRIKLGQDLELINHDSFAFCWIIDFPYFEKNKDTGKPDFFHNPFSMPQDDFEEQAKVDIFEIKSRQYDLVCNGYEIASGAIRNHKLDIMRKIFKIAGYSEGHEMQLFPALTEAFKYGAPPHGGIALGLERIFALLMDTKNVRETVPFPLNQRGEDPLNGAPTAAEPKQLQELGIKISNSLKN